jgi:hypothetical protein
MFLTTSERIKNTSDYIKIKSVIDRMDRANLIWLGRGQCIGMSDVICTALHQVGIKSKMVECQVIITNNNIQPPESVSIGYENSAAEGQIDTHVVVVTDTDIPMIIDASISYLLPSNKSILVDEVVDQSNRVFCNVSAGGFDLTYQKRLANKVIFEHQRSILERIETDRNIFQNLGFLKTLVIVALAVSSINALRGFYDFYARYYHDESLIGISATEAIVERLTALENTVKETNKR